MNKRAIQNQYERIKRRYENEATQALFLALRKQKAPVLKAAKNDGLMTAWLQIDKISPEPIMKSLNSLFRIIASREAARVYDSLIKEAGQKSLSSIFGINQTWVDEVNRFLAEYGLDKVVAEMTQTTKDRLLKTLMRGMQEGLSYSEIVNDLTDASFDRVRARLNARTQCNAAMNFGHMVGAQSLPFQVQKQWLSANDFRVRGRDGEDKASHWALNGVTVPEDGLFTDPRSGAQLAFPGDSSNGAGPQDVCNCRCSVLFIPVKDANGNTVLR
jgi:hypothetical protein